MALNKHNLQVHPLRQVLTYPRVWKDIKEYIFYLMALQGLLFWIWIAIEIVLALFNRVSIFN